MDTTDRLNVVIAHEQDSAQALLGHLCRSIKDMNPPEPARSKAMLLAKLNKFTPDIIFLSLLPDPDGLELLEIIKNKAPGCHTIVIYDSEIRSPDLLVAALEMGACESLEMPAELNDFKYEDFRLHLLTVSGLLRSRKRFARSPLPASGNRFFTPSKAGKADADQIINAVPGRQKVKVVAIASSTGGPEILSRIFSILPRNLKVPVLLVQHIPKAISLNFVRSLDEKSELTIVEAQDGDDILPGKVYVAPGGLHMAVSEPGSGECFKIRLEDTPRVNSVRPSADLLFESIAAAYGKSALAVVLTGMGVDGKDGVAKMKAKGGLCFTQSADTCVVYGMPKAVDEAGLSDASLDPLSLTQQIVMAVQ